MQAPSGADAEQQVKTRFSVRRLGVEIKIPAALRKRLLTLHSREEINQSVVAHVIVSDELSDGQSIGQPVISFFIFTVELGDGIGLMFNADSVLKQSHAALEQQAAIGVRTKHRNQFAAFEHHTESALLNEQHCNLSLVIEHFSVHRAQVAE